MSADPHIVRLPSLRERCESIVFEAIQALDVAATHAPESEQIRTSRERMVQHIKAMERMG